MAIIEDNIKRIEKDMSGKIRVWIKISDGNCQIFKFDRIPALDLIQKEVDKVAEIDRQIAELEERKGLLL